MRLIKYVIIAAVIVGGWWTGYSMKDRKAEVKPASEPSAPSVAIGQPKEPPLIDPDLILPPPSDQGSMIDMPIGDISQHFRDKAGLKRPNSEIQLTSIKRCGGWFPHWDAIDSDPPPLEPVNLPPVIRIPAQHDESPTKVDPTVKRVLHRQLAMWMYVNQRDLRLNFDITRRGSSGVKAIELWARRSADQEYECVDRMEGDKPPFATRLGSEGNYDLRLVFVSGSGVKSPTPTRSELPDVYVCLDTTPPAVELLSPSADETGVVKLRWKASDANLDEQPICLQYSIDGDTWIPVSEDDKWLPNTGEYAWKVPAGLPHEMHLRVQARDKAGNVGEARLPSKFSVDLVVPEGRISGVVEKGPVPRCDRNPDLRIYDLPPPDAACRELLPRPRSQILAEYSPNQRAWPVIASKESVESELLPMPREMHGLMLLVEPRIIIHSEEQEHPQEPIPKFDQGSNLDLIPPKWPQLKASEQCELHTNVAIGTNQELNFCHWMQTLRAKPVVTFEQKRPPTPFDAKESVYQRAKGYEPTQFARLPIAAIRLKLMKDFGERAPPIERPSGSFMLTGGIAPELCDALDELDPVVAPALLTDFVIPAPSQSDPYLSNRHASFLEQLNVRAPRRSFFRDSEGCFMGSPARFVNERGEEP